MAQYKLSIVPQEEQSVLAVTLPCQLQSPISPRNEQNIQNPTALSMHLHTA
jgi:hypothetical protein